MLLCVTFTYLWKFFAADARAGRIPTWKDVKLNGSDWNLFGKHSLYLLIGGYCDVADNQVNSVLIARLGTVDLAGNSLLWTMMSYPCECNEWRY